MARVEVRPTAFHYVAYDASVIAALASEMLDAVGYPADEDAVVEVDERTFFGRSRVLAVSPLHLHFESGAFEDAKQPRHFSERGTRESLGVVLHRAMDRRSPAYADAPADQELSLAQRSAWDAWCAARCERLGWEVSEPRRRYHFRARHGFSDATDAAFDRIWGADSLTWSELSALSDGLVAART